MANTLTHELAVEPLDSSILGLYGLGWSLRDIQARLLSLYGVDMDADAIEEVTAKALAQLAPWQSGPLHSLYTVMYVDVFDVNLKVNGLIRLRKFYVAFAINTAGVKELVGVWFGRSEPEDSGEAELAGREFWTKALQGLRDRGIEDILIAVCPEIFGIRAGFRSVFPATYVQTSVCHLLLESLNHISWQAAKPVKRDARAIYGAQNLESAEKALEAFSTKWKAKSPALAQTWVSNWSNIIPLFSYPIEVRRLLHLTHALESLNRPLRSAIKKKGVFVDEQSALQVACLALSDVAKRWNHPVTHWGGASAAFQQVFADRFDDGSR